MHDPTELRAWLSNWASRHDASKVSVHTATHPNCICESAQAETYGPVDDDELLLHFITSPSDVEIATHEARLKPRIFRKIFKKGMSVFRQKHMQERELRLTATELYRYASAQRKNQTENGGILGVITFRAADVRYCKHGESVRRLCCVLETPSETKPAHSDVVYAHHFSECERQDIENILFEQIGYTSGFRSLADFGEFDLTEFLPQKLKS